MENEDKPQTEKPKPLPFKKEVERLLTIEDGPTLKAEMEKAARVHEFFW